jgi:hypothetical protein
LIPRYKYIINFPLEEKNVGCIYAKPHIYLQVLELSYSLPTTRQPNDYLHGPHLRHATKKHVRHTQVVCLYYQLCGAPRRRILGAAVFFGASPTRKRKEEKKEA